MFQTSSRIVLSVGVVLTCFVLIAQSAQRQSFEVTSVKRASTNRYVPPALDPQRFRIVDTLGGAIEWAYDLQRYQLSGGPPWLNRDFFEIEGRSPSPATTAEMRTLLRSLLAERFKLRVHRESKQMPVYALIAGTPKMQPSKEPCGSSGCINVGPGVLMAKFATMRDIAATLSNMIDRPVLDKTGLNGRYDFRLKFDSTLIKRYDGQPNVSPNIDDPSIYAAVQEIGLKLDPRRAAVETLVIDSANEPLPD